MAAMQFKPKLLSKIARTTLLALASLLPAEAQAEAQVSEPAPRGVSFVEQLAVPFEKYALENGLEVILHRDPRLPTVAVNLWYHVGAAHEPQGRSGFAHLFEHLMFEGSKHAGDRFDSLLEAAGGTNMNGTTSWDRTNYFETVPAEHLELALWLEADRMGFMIDSLTQQSLDLQRDVVKNERREGYENSPYGPSWLKLYELLFPADHPYRGAVIGTMKDLSAASLDDVKGFFSRFYAPGNATLCLAGHFDADEARRLVQKHFGTLQARGGRAKARPYAVAEPLSNPRRVVVEEPVELAQVIWAWTAPAAFSEQEAPLELALAVLASGKSSRLYQALVTTGLANWVNAELDANELASIVAVDVGVASGKTVEEVEKTMALVIEQLQREGPTQSELARAQVGMDLDLASELQLLNSSGGEGGRAGMLQRFNHYLGDPGALASRVAQRRALSSRDIQRAMQILTQDRRATVITAPTPEREQQR